LGYRGRTVEGTEILHRGRLKTLTRAQRRVLRRRQAVEPVIGHLKEDHGMRRCWLKGAAGDALHAVLCACGYNLRWLLRRLALLWPLLRQARIAFLIRLSRNDAPQPILFAVG
jgi:IS5 family transposase